MKRSAFTIVAKNYIGLAQILCNSIHQHNPEVTVCIFVADEIENTDIDLPQNVILAKQVTGYTSEQWTDMAFKYDLTEFCTAIKPACFQYMMAQGYDQVIYFDPDIFIFSSLNEIYQVLEQAIVALTPQVAGIHVCYEGEHPEWAMNVNGIFNLGFCGMRNCDVTHKILQWWRIRLMDNSFADRSTGNFTDQKWMDWMPGLLNAQQLHVFRNLGMNMAPWNYFERKLSLNSNGEISVSYRTDDNPPRTDKLIFIHFAGYDYQAMKQGQIKRKRIENLQEYEDLYMATDIYRKAIMQQAKLFDSYIHQPYSYATYTNGTPIAGFHRRLYHGMTAEGCHYANPFATGKNTFYDAIKCKKMIPKQNLDRLSRQNIGNMDNKRRMIAYLFKALYRLMGYKRYVLFLKSLYFYCRPELHTFLIKKKHE